MLSHIDSQNLPTMVDIGEKAVTRREARAVSSVFLPEAVISILNASGELISAKGPVFQTAIIAGTMAAKRTHELIPFCHPLPLEQIEFEIQLKSEAPAQVDIYCRVRVHHKTGVEMEALTGASIAALTVYDMCKALSHEMVILETRLIGKSGGKRDIGQS